MDTNQFVKSLHSYGKQRKMNVNTGTQAVEIIDVS